MLHRPGAKNQTPDHFISETYFINMDDREKLQEEVRRQRANFDHPNSLESDLMARHVRTLIQGGSIARPVYDFKTHTRATNTERIQPRPVVICEGILLLGVTELRRSFDLRVFVDAPADVRALRRLRRDISERGRTAESVIKQYFETVRPMHEQFVEPARHTADIVLDWRHTAREQALTVMDKMRERLDDEPLTVST